MSISKRINMEEINITIDEIIKMQQKLKEKNILVEVANIKDLKNYHQQICYGVII